MRRFGYLALVLGIVLAALLVAIPLTDARAQESANATPVLSGVTFEPVARDVTSSLGAAPEGLELDWARFAPGASHFVALDDPSPLLVAVASGSLTVRSSTPLVVTRAAARTASGTSGQEEVAARTEITLRPGDAFLRPPNSEQELRNGGEEPAVALLASLAPTLPLETTNALVPPTDTGMVLALALVVPPHCPDGYTPAEMGPVATPGGGGGGGGAGGVAVAIAAAPECVGAEAGTRGEPAATPAP